MTSNFSVRDSNKSVSLSDKTRLLFRKDEIGDLANDVEVEFTIINSGTNTDPRAINCKVKFKISELKRRWDWNLDSNWLNEGKHSWSRFPSWAEANIIDGTLGPARNSPGIRESSVKVSRDIITRRQGAAVRKQSDKLFEGPLDEYLKSLWIYLISPELLIEWQSLINRTFSEEVHKYYLVRNGLTRELPGCGCVYENDEYTIITTDNEATVSAYEYFRTNKVTKAFELIELLRQRAILTGTIKPADLILEMSGNRKKINIPQIGGGFPSNKKPHRFLKYSHILDAKLDYDEACTDLQKLRAATLRTISPINIMLTHTAGGNVQYSHVHEVNGQRPENNDIGEDSNIRKYMVASMAKFLENAPESEAVQQEYFKLAQKPDYSEYIEKRNEILDQAKSMVVKIRPA